MWCCGGFLGTGMYGENLQNPPKHFKTKNDDEKKGGGLGRWFPLFFPWSMLLDLSIV
jgi:hypothetical protein